MSSPLVTSPSAQPDRLQFPDSVTGSGVIVKDPVKVPYAGRPLRIEGVKLRSWQGDITTLEIDAVVNAANNALVRGGGVCGAIFRAAGPGLGDACAAVGWCDTGDAVVTDGFALPARWIIHTVGPVWAGGDGGEADLLAACYRRAVAVADEVGARSIAFPAISTGIFGYPTEEAAEVAVAVLQAAPTTSVDEAVLVAFDDETATRYRELLDEAP
jgi:O-acetyl-ADP-ribose deacetylase